MAASPGDADAGGGGAAPLPDIPPYAERLKTVLQFVTGPSPADRNPDLIIRRMAMSGISRVKVNVS